MTENKMDFMFIIAAHHNNQNSQLVYPYCVKSIRKLYPNNLIVIVNDSEQSILSDECIKNNLNDENIHVIHTEILGSGVAFTLNVFNKYINYNYAVILQDSTELIKKLPPINFDIKFFWSFSNHFKWDSTFFIKNGLKISHTQEIINLSQNLEESDFKKNFIELYNNKKLWRGCFGNMVVISKQFLNLLNEKTKILNLTNFIKTRRDRMCIESILALAVFYTKKINVKSESLYTLQGNWTNFCITNKITRSNMERSQGGAKGEYIIKFTYGR